jgi:hypothetical protein
MGCCCFFCSRSRSECRAVARWLVNIRCPFPSLYQRNATKATKATKARQRPPFSPSHPGFATKTTAHDTKSPNSIIPCLIPQLWASAEEMPLTELVLQALEASAQAAQARLARPHHKARRESPQQLRSQTNSRRKYKKPYVGLPKLNWNDRRGGLTATK